jgi:hypothetical protein
MKFTVPAFVSSTHPEVERLIFAFENARRRAYRMKQKDIDRLVIIRQLNREIRIPARYVSTAYDTIKKMPPHVTFGGKKAQQLRQQDKLTHGSIVCAGTEFWLAEASMRRRETCASEL